MSAFSAWAGDNFKVEFDETGTTATIISKAGDGAFNSLSDPNGAKVEFGEGDWNRILQCTTLNFVGNIESLDAFNNNVSSATTVDFSETKFKTTGRTTSMSFKPWQGTIETAITSNYLAVDEGYDKGNLFGQPQKLEKVVFNSGILNGICNNASDAPNFTDLEIGPKVATIADEAFRGITSLVNVDMRHASGLTYIGKNAFFQCEGLVEVEMGGLDGECTFGESAFENCFNLKHFTMAENVPYISKKLFYSCYKLESVRIPNTCKYIDDEAFMNCKSMHIITLPDGLEEVRHKAFENAGITDIYIMAKSVERLPKIYGCEDGAQDPSFTKAHAMGNAAFPSPWIPGTEGSKNDIIGDLVFDDVVSWYQDELTNGQGLGQGNSIILLHYPDEMKDFFEGVDPVNDMDNVNWSQVPGAQSADQWINKVSTTDRQHYVEFKLWKAQQLAAEGEDPSLVDAYYWNPDEYNAWAEAKGYNHNVGNSVEWLGPDANGAYYPMQTDYDMRMASGYVDGHAISQWAWRQFPLAFSLSDAGERDFSKEYDDTWYTMCWPWKLYDEQLFRAFNQKCEIAEFVGVEVLEDAENSTPESKKMDLIFHFDKVASTHYVDDNNIEYERTKIEGVVDPAGNNVYTYTSLDGTNKVVTYNSDPKTQAYKDYYKIQNIMVFPGHPYMIHPAVGASPGKPTPLIFDDLKKVQVPEGKTMKQVLDGMVEGIMPNGEENEHWGKVTVKATTATRAYDKDEEGNIIGFIYDNIEEYKDEKGNGGSYTFIGNINSMIDETGDDERDLKKTTMPQYSYFLSLVNDSNPYPRYFRKTKEEADTWSPFTAVIQPDAAAIATIEKHIVRDSSSANESNVTWGDWEKVTPDEINDIIADAESQGKEVKKMYINVVFNVNGEVVRTNSNSVEGLPSGLYIVNGKKYMVK